VGKKTQVDLSEFGGTEGGATRWRPAREIDLCSWILAHEASVDSGCEGGSGGQDHRFLRSDPVACFRVGSRFDAGAAHPPNNIGGTDPSCVTVSGPVDESVERLRVAVVAGECREMGLCDLADTDERPGVLECAGQPSQVVW